MVSGAATGSGLAPKRLEQFRTVLADRDKDLWGPWARELLEAYDRLRADQERLREALKRIKQGPERESWYIARVALEADQERLEQSLDDARRWIREEGVRRGKEIERLRRAGNALADASICRRFTMEFCRQRPELPQSEWCESCLKVAAWRGAAGS